ncbi:YcjF family protein [Vibrio sonorensis]|uniref:YcjF family protein n=1 Tax=Vibrio sonorensis TaxID=1004316 RepID=UPI0008D97C68|nr:TIGR01620 family protein [Vibrio sonorensis]
MSEFKQKKVFTESLNESLDASITESKLFEETQTFVPVKVEQETPVEEVKLEQVIRPKVGRRRLATGLLATFTGLTIWQTGDSAYQALLSGDMLAIGWTGFVAVLAALGIGAIGKELWKLKRLKNHFDKQQESEALINADSFGKGKDFCYSLAKAAGLPKEASAFVRWQDAVTQAHSDAEILDMYDAMVVAEQDKLATKLITQHATESAALVAISPLAIADMLLVAWRNFKMIDNLSEVYGVELGYWSRVKLLKATLVNMAAAGASELAIDASMDLMSMDLAGKVSARAGQGLGVGILTARLGLKAMTLLRPIPWHQDRKVKLGAIRKQIVSKIAEITIK